MKIDLTREEIISANIRSFSRLSPSAKIRYVEKARKRLAYFRTLSSSASQKSKGRNSA